MELLIQDNVNPKELEPRTLIAIGRSIATVADRRPAARTSVYVAEGIAAAVKVVGDAKVAPPAWYDRVDERAPHERADGDTCRVGRARTMCALEMAPKRGEPLLVLWEGV